MKKQVARSCENSSGQLISLPGRQGLKAFPQLLPGVLIDNALNQMYRSFNAIAGRVNA